MPSDADQVANLDAELDALDSPTTVEVLARSRDYDAGFVAASAVARAAAGGGGGSLPAGGTTGEVLTKASNADGDADWEAGGGLPEGWTQAGDPADVDAEGGSLTAGALTALFLDVGDNTHAGVFAVYDGAGGAARVMSRTSDPSAGGGVAALLGSMLLRTTGQAWLKTGAGNTAWTQIGGVDAGAIQKERVTVTDADITYDTPNGAGIAELWTPPTGALLVGAAVIPTEAGLGGMVGLYAFTAGGATYDDLNEQLSFLTGNPDLDTLPSGTYRQSLQVEFAPVGQTNKGNILSAGAAVYLETDTDPVAGEAVFDFYYVAA